LAIHGNPAGQQAASDQSATRLERPTQLRQPPGHRNGVDPRLNNGIPQPRIVPLS
jgi:hypothetical protein